MHCTRCSAVVHRARCGAVVHGAVVNSARCVAQFTVNGVMHSALHGERCTRQCTLRCVLNLFLQDGGIGVDSQLIRFGVDGLKEKGRKTFAEGKKLWLA